MRFYSLCILLIIIALHSSCESDKPSKKKKTSKPPIVFNMKGDTVVYHDTVLFKTETGKPAAENEQITQITLSYPYLDSFSKNPALCDTINRIVKSLMLLDEYGEIAFKSLSSRMSDFIEEYKEAKKDMAMVGSNFDMKWSCEVDIKVILNTPALLSLRFFELNFTGGAHANYTTRYFNFDVLTGKQLKLEDILVPDYKDKIRPIAEKKFKQAAQLPEDMNLANSDFQFENGQFDVPKNFAITRSGLRFAFNPYEISAFSMGSIEFEVPYQDILDLANRNVLK